MFGFRNGDITAPSKDYLLWGLFYLAAHGGILLIPNAIYWDDWVLYRVDPEVIFDTFSQAGSMFNIAGYLHTSLLTTGPWIYKVLTFLLMFASGILLNLILKRFEFLSKETRFFIVLLFLVLPFNMARVALIDFPYTLCYFLFFLAWALMERFRLLALLLFFLSFNTNSLLMFYALPFFDMLYRSGNFINLKLIIKYGLNRLDFVLLPFFYFIIKIYFFKPYGLYEGYNESYELHWIKESFITQREDFYLFYDLLRDQVGWGLCLSFSIMTFVILFFYRFGSSENKSVLWGMPFFGGLVFLLGVFPYWITGKVPLFNDLASRFQLLLPLGSALVIVGILNISWVVCCKFGRFFCRAMRVVKYSIISLIVGSSIAFNTSTFAALFVDWQKQQQLIQLFHNSPKLEHAGLIVFKDNTLSLNALKRTYNFYEWNGMMSIAFGNEKRFGINKSEISNYMTGQYDKYFLSMYKAGLYKKDSTMSQIFVEINLAKPENSYEKIMCRAFPKLTLTASGIDLDNPY